MAKNSPGTLNSKTVRISLATYRFLKEISDHDGLSFAEALDNLITNLKNKAKESPGSEIMSFAYVPVASARAIPVTTARASRSMPVNTSFSREVEHV